MTQSENEIGKFRLNVVDGGSLWLDGGAMFGIVPKVLWSREESPDERNRIKLNCNCLLVRDGSNNILIETGLGTHWSKKERDIYNITTANVDRSLALLGLEREEITHVINTHLHFDHAGGNLVTQYDQLVPAFPNARYIVQAREWKHAMSPSTKDRASYRPNDYTPLAHHGRLHFVEGEEEIVAGVVVHHVGGHSPGMQIVEITDDDERAVFLADLIPSRHHVRIPWVMAYDCFPMETIKVKESLLHDWTESRTLMILYHDTTTSFGYLIEERAGSFKLRPAT